MPTKTSDLTNDSGFISASNVLQIPTFDTTETVANIRTFANNNLGKMFCWHLYGTATYAPTADASAYWIFTLYCQDAPSVTGNYVYFTALNNNTGELYISDRNNNWIKQTNVNDFKRNYQAPSGSIVCTNNTMTTIASAVAPPGDGRCLILASFNFDTNTTGFREAIITSSNTGTSAISRFLIDRRAPVTGDPTYVKFCGTYTCTAGATYYLRAKQNSGGNLSASFIALEIIRLPSYT